MEIKVKPLEVKILYWIGSIIDFNHIFLNISKVFLIEYNYKINKQNH